ncbi:MAG: peptidylprolyl isomerase [Halieaceae bacterium]
MKQIIGIFFLAMIALQASAKDPEVLFKTSEGEFTVRLFADQSPVTVENFLAYVDSGFYDGTIFHRVIPRFMIQTGGFNPGMKEKRNNPPIINEAKNRLHNERGTLAMARTNDPNSATSQFFINVRTNLNLDWTPRNPGYAVFGEVIDGMYVVDSIAIAPTQNFMGHGDVPITPIIIESARRIGEEPAPAAETEATAEAEAETEETE